MAVLTIGECARCGKPIISGEGIHVDGNGGKWHPQCRNAPTTDVPKRRGRPPKTDGVSVKVNMPPAEDQAA